MDVASPLGGVPPLELTGDPQAVRSGRSTAVLQQLTVLVIGLADDPEEGCALLDAHQLGLIRSRIGNAHLLLALLRDETVRLLQHREERAALQVPFLQALHPLRRQESRFHHERLPVNHTQAGHLIERVAQHLSKPLGQRLVALDPLQIQQSGRDPASLLRGGPAERQETLQVPGIFALGHIGARARP